MVLFAIGIILALVLIIAAPFVKRYTKKVITIRKGEYGEEVVNIILERVLDADEKYLYDYKYSADNTSTQIDHIVIKHNGIFIIETKNYSGKIYGFENQLMWKQYINNKPIEFYNPVKQNKTHIFYLNKILNNAYPIYSIIVFVNGDISKISISEVIKYTELEHKLQQYSDYYLNNEAINNIYNILENNQNFEISNKEHIEHIEELKEAIENSKCPRCKSNLILKKSKYGEFYGCENYPNCKFTKRI